VLYATPWQTVGPYVSIGTTWLVHGNLVGDDVTGQRITLEGTLVDGHGAPIPDGMIEIWQANAHGRYRHPEDARDLPLEPGFTGFGRVLTDDQGRFRFETVKPGRVPGFDGRSQAPHIVVSVFGRGVIKRLCTRIYFADEASNADDPVLARVPAQRRGTLIAQREREGAYRFDVVIQGDAHGWGETVFFDF
jgi:protocatechuate 3,4-dioxygenase alpha subunit